MMTPPTQSAASAAPHTMQCMEVWGGNREVDNGVIMPGLDAWVYSKPYAASRSGGDVHYVSSCATGRITRLLLADVSGHGADVGEIGERLRTLMRRYVNYLDQSKFIANLNREFRSISGKGGFATAVAATYWAPTSVLVACNAGHPRPLLYRAGQKEWRRLEHTPTGAHDDDDQTDTIRNLPLGVIASTEYEQFGVRLRKGDLVLFYTDSLIEARPTTPLEKGGNTLLGEDGLLDIIKELNTDDPQQFMRDLLARVSEYRGGEPADDDLTILLFRHNGTRPQPTFADRLRAPLRILRNLLRAVLGREPLAWPEFGLTTWGGTMLDPLNNRWGGRTP